MTKSKIGRPFGTFRNARLRELIVKHNCSRQWAYVLLRREKKS